MKNKAQKYLFHLLILLIFCLLPFSTWPKIVIPNVPATLFPWREIIVFVFPVLYLLLYKRPILKVPFFVPLIVMSVGVLFLCMFSVVGSLVSGFFVAVGALNYFAVVSLVWLFSSFNYYEFRRASIFLAVGIAIAGLGLILDYASGYKIHQMIAMEGFRENISDQITPVARTSFLFAGPTTAASFICVGSVALMILFIHGFRLNNISRRLVFLNAVCIAIGFAGAAFTFSRVAFAGIFLSSLGLILYLKNFGIYILLLLGSVLSALVFWFIADREAIEFLEVRVESLYGGGTNLEYSSDQHRIYRWIEGLSDMWENLIIGEGIGTGNTRNRNLGLMINHYESFPLWVINEAGIFGFILMFFPYYMSAYFIFKNQIPLWEKLIALYLTSVIYALIFVNPGGGSFDIIAIAALMLGGVYRFHSHRAEVWARFRSRGAVPAGQVIFKSKR